MIRALRAADRAIADWERAQKLAQSFSVAQWQSKFQRLAAQFCPVVEKFSRGYHWSVMQVEYSSTSLKARRNTKIADRY